LGARCAKFVTTKFELCSYIYVELQAHSIGDVGIQKHDPRAMNWPQTVKVEHFDQFKARWSLFYNSE